LRILLEILSGLRKSRLIIFHLLNPRLSKGCWGISRLLIFMKRKALKDMKRLTSFAIKYYHIYIIFIIYNNDNNDDNDNNDNNDNNDDNDNRYLQTIKSKE
jgi:hypothetical protein